MPNIGYGSNAKTRHMLPTGFRKVLVHNVKVSIETQGYFIFSFVYMYSSVYMYFMYTLYSFQYILQYLGSWFQ